jgi:glycosyltransferase involved in cell wall biosynthesis
LISILIPTYNYNIFPLVEKLYNEILKDAISCEILVCDDDSPRPSPENENIEKFENVNYLISENNLGRTSVRLLLAKKALYDNLLFLDADVMPKSNTFIGSYVKEIGNDVVFGGITYEEQPPSADKILRWKYGRERETVSLVERVKQPYLSINSGCFMIKRDLFLRVSEKLQLKKYGLDNYFKELLRKENATIHHIENPAEHLGLESNEKFLQKALEAIDTTVYLEKENKLSDNVRPIQKYYLKLKRIWLTGLFSSFISIFKKRMERNFISANPNLFWFDLYRLQYYIQLKNKKSA